MPASMIRLDAKNERLYTGEANAHHGVGSELP